MIKSTTIFQISRLLTIALLLPIFLLSCSEDEASGDTSGELRGTWQLTEYTSNTSASTTAEGTTLTIESDGVAENIDAIVAFTENPNEVSSEGSFDIVLTSSIAGQTETETVSIDDFSSVSTWSRDGDILTFENGNIISIDTDLELIDPEDAVINYTIEELTDTTLRLSSSLSQTIEQEGIEFDVDANIRMVLVRQ